MSDTRDRVLAAAKEMVVGDGSQAVSMRKIGAIVGVTPMAVYRHFPSREALLDAVAAECFTELADIWRALSFPEDVGEATKVIVDAFVDVALESPGLFSFLFIEERHRARRFPDDFTAGESPTFDLLTAYVVKAVEAGRLRPIEPWRIALAHTALIHGLTQMYINGRINLTGPEFRQLCHDTTELLVNGTTPRLPSALAPRCRASEPPSARCRPRPSPPSTPDSMTGSPGCASSAASPPRCTPAPPTNRKSFVDTRNSKLLWTSLAAVAATVMYYFGTALEPIPWLPLLLWVAPLPLLLVAPRLGAMVSFGVCAVAWLVSQLPLYWYFWDSLEMPIVLVAGFAVITAAAFGVCVLLFRGLARQGRFWLAVVATPAAWVCVEFGISWATADAAGNWWSLAYTQADFQPVLQTAAIAGTAGVSFLLVAVPSAVAALLASGTTPRSRALVGGTVVLLLAATLGYGFVRPQIGGTTEKVSAIGLPQSVDSLPIAKGEAEELFDDYHTELAELADVGVSVAVLPEKVFLVTEDETKPYFSDWGELAADLGMNVVVGMTLHEKDKMSNVAVWFPEDGSKATIYRKNHLIPGIEDHLTTSRALTFVPGHEGWAMAICKDLDYAELPARYREAGATVLFTPALEFNVDGWWHSRIAITRGAEQGIAVVRSGLLGPMTISDQYGRVLAEDGRVAVAEVSTDGAATLYSRFGDWLVWVSIGLTVLALLFAVRRRSRRT